MAPAQQKRKPARGLELWLTVQGTPFTVWDRWLLTLIHAEHHGDWQPVRDALRQRANSASFGRDDAEAKLSQLRDLDRRWRALDERGRARLVEGCRETAVRRRAHAKVFERYAGEADKTPAMHETPRRVLRAHQRNNALELLGELHVTHRSFDMFEKLAAEMGSDTWRGVVAMAETAAQAGQRDLAARVFAAADQPGLHRDYLRERARQLGILQLPIRTRAPLRLVAPPGAAGASKRR